MSYPIATEQSAKNKKMAHLELEITQQSSITNEILEKTNEKMGFIPNMYVTMGANPALLDAYTYAYKSFRTNAGFTPVEQEVIFLSVSYENNCPYCIAAHSFVGDKMTHVPTEITNAIREGKQIPDKKLAALSKITRSLTKEKGNITQIEINEFLNSGYSKTHILGIIAGIGIKTMSNYSNHLTNPQIDDVFSYRIWNK